MKAVANLETRIFKGKSHLIIFSLERLQGKDLEKSYLGSCVKNRKGLQRSETKVFLVENRKNKNMTTFQIL